MLTEQLTADAAALHQAILHHGGEVSPFFCGEELGWEHRRIARARRRACRSWREPRHRHPWR